MKIIRTPGQAPDANAICESVVGILRRECLDRLIIFGRRHLDAVLTEYLTHYNGQRPHRALGQRCPAPFLVSQSLEPESHIMDVTCLAG